MIAEIQREKFEKWGISASYQDNPERYTIRHPSLNQDRTLTRTEFDQFWLRILIYDLNLEKKLPHCAKVAGDLARGDIDIPGLAQKAYEQAYLLSAEHDCIYWGLDIAIRYLNNPNLDWGRNILKRDLIAEGSNNDEAEYCTGGLVRILLKEELERRRERLRQFQAQNSR